MKYNNVNICFTIDYELYFGENYLSEEEVLFNTTDYLLNRLNNIKIPIVIFVDVLSIEAYKREFGEDCSYIQRMKKQLQEAYKRGNEIALHIHPHWLKTTYDRDNNKWNFDMNYYSLSSYLKEYGVNKINEIITLGINILKELLNDRKYQCISFRAGGYSIENCEKQLIEALIKNGIKIDSSVYPYLKLESEYFHVDFSNVPNDNYWYILNSFKLKEKKSSLLEIPLISLKKSKINIFIRILNKIILLFYSDKQMKRKGRAIAFKSTSKKEYGISFDFFQKKHSFLMNIILLKYIKQFKKLDEIYVVINSHPKSMNNETIDNIVIFLKQLQRKRIKFITFKNLVIKK